MNHLPFRRRLTVWSTLVAGVSILVCGAAGSWFIYEREVLEIDTELRTDVDHLLAELHREGGAKYNWKEIRDDIREWLPARTPVRFTEIRTGDQVRWISKRLRPNSIPRLGPGFHNYVMDGKRLRLLQEDRDGIQVLMASTFEEPEAMVQSLCVAIAVGLPFALAFAWLGGRRVSRLAVEPIVEMTEAAEKVTADRFDQRVPVPSVADELQRHARALNATFERLEQSYRQASRFSGDASHELKTPLTVLRSSIEAVLKSPSLEQNDRAAITGLLEQTRRLSEITASLLLLARADAGRLQLDFEEGDLTTLIEACVEDARIVAEERNVQVECSLPQTAPCQLDPMRITQITCNLLDNAVKYNVPGGRVSVSLKEGHTDWQLCVGNTGPEIAPEYHNRLFQRFYRAEHTATEAGTGLGLSLSRELARAHCGDLQLHRSADGWTEFIMTVPKNSPSECKTCVTGPKREKFEKQATSAAG